jgi:hypothetical protein
VSRVINPRILSKVVGWFVQKDLPDEKMAVTVMAGTLLNNKYVI